MAVLRELTERDRAIINKYSAQHDPVRGFTQPIADDTGAVSMPLLRLNTILRLEQRGVIDRASAEAAERFALLFRVGSLDPLKAGDVSRVPLPPGMSRGDLSTSGERCRRQVTAAMTALGGAGSAAASAVWHVCGLEMSVRQWALSTRRKEGLACGVLVGALSALAAHFAGHGHRPKPRPRAP